MKDYATTKQYDGHIEYLEPTGNHLVDVVRKTRERWWARWVSNPNMGVFRGNRGESTH
jgi:hypothetical protein